MMPKQPLDFSKVEALRRHMLLTTQDMSEVLGVSRMTYYGWVKKGTTTLRKSNDEAVRLTLKKLLSIMSVHHWPMPEVIASGQKERKARLLELLKEVS
jgi:DNA-binding XRE family transcriptional regulator